MRPRFLLPLLFLLVCYGPVHYSLPAGEQELEFHPGALVGGMYFVRVRTEEQSIALPLFIRK